MAPQTQPAEVGSVLPLSDSNEGLPIDQDAQLAIQDFVESTEFLPADIFRSLRLIKRLDHRYVESSTKLDALARQYSDSTARERKQIKARMIRLVQLAVKDRQETVVEANKLYHMVDEQFKMVNEEIEEYDQWPIMDSDEEMQAHELAERAKERAEEKAQQQALRASMKTALKKEKRKPRQLALQPLPAGYPTLSSAELGRLRKKMKKNPQWEPSEKVVRRELIMLGKLQADGQMWPEDVATAEAAGLQPTMPANRALDHPKNDVVATAQHISPPPAPKRIRESAMVEKEQKGDNIEKKTSEKKVSHKKKKHVSKIKAQEEEPRYCICNDVSYGEMVACDNDSCPYEWYHFGCVGLKTSPRGAWFCPICTRDRKENAVIHSSPKRRKK